MSGYTRISCLLWEWHRLNALSATTRLFWLALYTSAPAKRGVPALWHGSVVTMAEAARLPMDEAVRALDTLLDQELAEYDPKSLVLRLTELPDAGEWPSNPGILESWYKRFRMVPECGVRNAHVSTIRWLLERGALEASKNARGAPTAKHEQVWSETFGTVPIPPARKRGLRRHADNNDTGNDIQPSLFGASEVRVSESGGSAPLDLPDQIKSGTPTPWIQGPEREKEKEKEFLSFLGEGSRSSGASDAPPVERPRLALVPPPPDHAAEIADLLADIAAGAQMDPAITGIREGTQAGLRATIAQLTAAECTTAERRAIGSWMRARCSLSAVSGDPRSKLSAWAAIPGMALAALNAVREQDRARENVQDQLDAAKASLRIP